MHATRRRIKRSMPAAVWQRTTMFVSWWLLVGCGAAQPAADNAGGDPCREGATSAEAERCLDSAESLRKTDPDGAAKLASKVCGGELSTRDQARCFNLGVMVR